MTAEKPWRCEQLSNDEVHVTPEVGSDHIEHDLSEDCVCGPTTEPVKREEDGSVGYVIVHHSLDGREAQEQRA